VASSDVAILVASYFCVPGNGQFEEDACAGLLQSTSDCGGGASLCQISLDTCFDFVRGFCANRYDYVEVFDGNSAESKLLGRHCGSEVR